jgi:hypothetical protein
MSAFHSDGVEDSSQKICCAMCSCISEGLAALFLKLCLRIPDFPEYRSSMLLRSVLMYTASYTGRLESSESDLYYFSPFPYYFFMSFRSTCSHHLFFKLLQCSCFLGVECEVLRAVEQNVNIKISS